MKREGSQKLRIYSWNSRGLSAAVPCIRALMAKCDVLTLSEHWLHNNRLNQLENLSDDFNICARASRDSSEESYGLRRGQGGVAVLWRKSLKGISAIETIKHNRICGIRVQTTDGAILVILSIYLPASGSSTDLSVTLNELEGIMDALEEDAIPIICGDYNGHMGTLGGPRGIGPPTNAGRLVHKFMNRQNLFAANMLNSATGNQNTYVGHNGSSTIDYIMAPKYLCERLVEMHTGGYDALNTSDHLPLYAVFNIGMLPRSVEFKIKSDRLRWDKLSQDDMSGIYQVSLYPRLAELCQNIQASQRSPAQIDGFFDELTQILHSTAKAIPRSKFQKHLKPYWSPELNNLKKVKMMWFNKWKEEGRTKDENNYVRIQMKLSKKNFAKHLRSISKQYENQSIAEATRLAEVDHDKFWRLFRRNNSATIALALTLLKTNMVKLCMRLMTF